MESEINSQGDSYSKGMSNFEVADYDSIQRLTRFEYDLFKRYLGERLLEIGAGWGRVTELVQNEHQPKELVAIEPSPDLFSKMQRRLSSKNMTLMNCEVSTLQPRYVNYFNSIFSVHVMEHIQDDRQFIIDSLALLKPGGKLIILVPALQILYSNLDRNIGHFRRYDKKMIRHLTSGLDIKIDRLFYSNLLGVLASLYFIKYRKLEYQSQEKKGKFVFLFKLYDRFFIPAVAFMEKIIPVPIGLNLTLILEKH